MSKLIIITGVSRGVGKITAEYLANFGYDIIALSRDQISYDNKKITGYQIDITNEEAIQKLASALNRKEVFAIINNAAASLDNNEVFNPNIDYWKLAYSINVLAPLILIKEFYDSLLVNKGHIINITSIGAHYPNKNSGHYLVSKGAKSVMTEILRLETVGTGIKVTELIPGMINTYGDNPNALDPKDISECIRWILNLPQYMNIDILQTTHVNNGKY